MKPFGIPWWIEQYKMAIESKMRAYSLIEQGQSSLIDQYTRLDELSKYIRQRLINKIDNEIEESLWDHH